MATTTHTITSTSKMSNTSYHKRCRTAGQRLWWLRGPDGFVDIPRVRGDCEFRVDLDLEPGYYTLGCGPAGKFGVREGIDIVGTLPAMTEGGS